MNRLSPILANEIFMFILRDLEHIYDNSIFLHPAREKLEMELYILFSCMANSIQKYVPWIKDNEITELMIKDGFAKLLGQIQDLKDENN